MSKIVLCVDKGNSYIEETISYLQENDCRVYRIQNITEENLKNILGEIELNEGQLDILLLGANNQIAEDSPIGNTHNVDQLLSLLDEQIYDMETVIESALSLLQKSKLKRIGMITEASSSISYCRDNQNYGQHMVLAGLNMLGKIYFNRLRPEGFTFRWYCADSGIGGISAGEYLLTGLSYDPKEPYIHSDENRLVMRDRYLREIPW